MTALETIQAAIEKLEALKAESTPGTWTILDGGDRFIAEEDPLGDGPFEYIVTEPVDFRRQADCDLIELLHRTIDAQLAILQDTQRALLDPMFGALTENVYAYQIDLARAILGES